MRFQEILNTCLNFITTISVWDIIDVAIIAFLIYRVIIFARKSGAGSVIKGIVLLIAAMWLSSLLHLSVVSYLLGKTFELGLLALIVLFQPELRELLGKFGNSTFSGFFGKRTPAKEIESAISQTVRACTDMAQTKTGALIVFQRTVNLDSFINSGTIINADVSAELLKNIFFKNTPLHDGAVIIADGKIAAAACMLPLSSSNHLSRDLGMRHRAGVGMSERSDAVIAVVSEEDGSISVAIEGMLKRHLTTQTFEMLLRNELLPAQEEEESGRGRKLLKMFSGRED